MPSIGGKRRFGVRPPPRLGQSQASVAFVPLSADSVAGTPGAVRRGTPALPPSSLGFLPLPSPSSPPTLRGRRGGAPRRARMSRARLPVDVSSPRCPRYACVRPAGEKRSSGGLGLNKAVGSVREGGCGGAPRAGLAPASGHPTAKAELREPPVPGSHAASLSSLFPPVSGRGEGEVRALLFFDYDLRSDETTR